MTISLSEAIEFYKRYRHDMSLLMAEKRYVMEAYWKHIDKEKDDAMSYGDWLFNYYFSGFEAKNDKEKESQA